MYDVYILGNIFFKRYIVNRASDRPHHHRGLLQLHTEILDHGCDGQINTVHGTMQGVLIRSKLGQ